MAGIISQQTTPVYFPVDMMSEETNDSQCPEEGEWYFCGEYTDLTQIPTVRNVIILLYAIVMAIGIGGNAMVIAVVVRHRHMRTPTNYYIVSLAFSDLFLTAFAVPLKLIELSADMEDSIHNPIVCSILGFLIPMFVFTSVWTLTAISIDRYLVIVHPLRSRNFNTKSRAIRVISIVWIVPFFLLAPYFLPHQVYAYYAFSDYGVIRRDVCTEDLHQLINPNFQMAYAMLLLLVLYFIPTMVLCFTCGSIALRLLGVTDQQSIIKSSLRKEEAGRRKVAKMVLIVCFAFALCWTPFFAAQIISIYSTILTRSNFFFILLIVHLFAFSNSLMNPVIYFLLSQAFRRGFLSIMACLFPCFKSRLIKEPRAVTGVSTSEMGDNSRGDLSGSRKRAHGGGRGMSWRNETTQYSAISEAPEEIDMAKMSSADKATNHHSNSSSNHNNCNNGGPVDNGLQKIEEVGESDARGEEEDLMSGNASACHDDCGKNLNIETEINKTNTNDTAFTDVDLRDINDEKCKYNANIAPPRVIVNSYS